MRIVRYTFVERVIHAAAALVFLYVLLTGLALWTPGLYWIATVLGGGFLSRALHPWAGVLLFVLVVWMLRAWHGDMRVTDDDRQWRRAMPKYMRNEDRDVPGAGRFNYGQKIFFWATTWGTVVLLVSGLILWQPDMVPAGARILLDLAVLTHAIAALVVIGAFIVHVYMGVFVVPGSVDAILRGDVSAEWARHHHRLWAEDSEHRTPAAGPVDRTTS